MASDTAPAAVPGPNTPPPSTAPTHPATSGTQQPTDGLAGLLAPVQPTRTAFSLDPDNTATTAHGEQNVTDASSAGYSTENPADGSTEKTQKNTTGRQERSVIRAWMLAGAERWKKGADARNKRLDIKKARAQARQVKETITVNRSEKLGGGSSNPSTGGNSGKSLNSKNSKASPESGPKNSTTNASGGSSGPGGSPRSGSRTPSGSGTGSRSDKASGPNTSSGNKPAKDSSGKSPSSGTGKPHSEGTSSSGTSGRKQAADNTKGPGSTGAGKAGAQGPAGKAGKDTTSNGAGPAKGTREQDTTNRPWKDRTPNTGEKTPKPAAPTNTHGPNTTGPKTPQTSPKPGPAAPPGTLGKGHWKNLFTTKPDADPNKGPGKDVTTGPKTGKTSKDNKPAPRPRIDTRQSREAGYRDGTRVGKVIAHTHAYRDGYRDGRTDTAQAAADDKKRLDQAHTDRKTARTQPEKDQAVTQPATSADYQQPIPPKPDHAPGPRPVPVTGIDATHIHLGDDAARPSISRGEVRTLRRFQQRLQDKTDRMTTVAEATRTLEHHAQEQAKQVTQLLEQARGVKGGEKLVAALAKLAEAADVQAAKAAEINKRAVRSQEACKALTANTETRYGGIYQAVIDSPETSPAEMTYYREMSHA